MTILITGSSGHLGEALVRLLREEFGKDEVRGLDILESPFTDVVGSIVDPATCKEAMKGVAAVLHTASLHKPHVETHTRQDFIDVNITGTLNLLEAAVESGTVKSFIFTSTTSSFGDSLKPLPGEGAVWIDEMVRPKPKNIYGITKLAAEELCQLFHRLHGLPCLVLKGSRFFPEDDDTKEVRDFCSAENSKVNELLYRRADIYDMATAHRIAIDKAPEIGFDKFIITSTSPFQQSDRPQLQVDAIKVVQSYYPNMERIYAKAGFKFFETVDRVYRNDHARKVLGWEPKYSFAKALECLEQGKPIGSDLSRQVGKKYYHRGKITDPAGVKDGEPYPCSIS